MAKPKFFKKILKNGMTIIFEQRKGSGVISLAFAVKYGGIHESKNEKGISHFIEHMLYKGTRNRTAKQISEEIEKNGGILNGFTEDELTAYWCKMPANKIKIALDVLSDMMLNPLFDEKEIVKERKVIIEEIKMRKDNPQIYVTDRIQNLLYSGNLGMDLIGNEKTLASLDRKKLVNKFKKVYGSENMILCAVGDANFKKLCNFCERKFKKSGFKINKLKIRLKNQKKIEKRYGLDQANLVFAYHIPCALQKGNYAAQVLSCLMAGGMSSKLWQEIREKRNLAYSVKGFFNIGKNFGYSAIYVGTSPENINIVKKIILEEFEKLKKLDEKEVEAAKEQLIGNSKISREDSQGQMLDLLYNEVWGNAKSSYEYEKKIKKVKLEDVKNIAKLAKRYSFIALIPQYKRVQERKK